MEKEIVKAAELIDEVYNTHDGIVGGYGHIVFDDGNTETHHVEFCIEEAKKGGYGLSEETRVASLKALEAMLLLSEKERNKVLRYRYNK